MSLLSCPAKASILDDIIQTLVNNNQEFRVLQYRSLFVKMTITL